MNAKTSRFSAVSVFALAAAFSAMPMSAAHAMGHSHGPTPQAAQPQEPSAQMQNLENRQQQMETSVQAELAALRKEIEELKAQAALSKTVAVSN